MDIISKLQRNPKHIYQEAVRLLTKIAENILQDPSNKKLRTLQKSNPTISKKILNVFGGTDCLILMGFKEEPSCLVLPAEASLDKLQEVKDDIIKYQKLYMENNGAVPKANRNADALVQVQKPEEIINKVELPPFHRKHTNDFLNSIAYTFHLAQVYDNKELQERARQLIPMAYLEQNAVKNLRTLQKELKKGGVHDFDGTIQDMLILELLNWFKEDFFSWVDSPTCENCGNVTKFSHMSTDPNILKYTNRVEMHKCQSCNALTPFPRYNDLNILMATRKGRCGEWANCFTLFCRAMGWDARHVIGEMDHVWTEVYSFGEKRWIHCDPCENVSDTPLMYEFGWNRQVSYVIAYSGEEVQDVTWRYSSKHKEVLMRRQRCSEEELITVLVELRKERQKVLTESRRKYLTNRLLEELCELMVEKQPSEKDKKGRNSGSLAWRLARGEQLINYTPFTWKFTKELLQQPLNFRYFSALNRYELLPENNSNSNNIQGWENGVFEVTGIFRKKEKDWNMVYLSRTESDEVGILKWVFEVDDTNGVFDSMDVYFDYMLYENGNVEITIAGDLEKVTFPPGEKNFIIHNLSGSKRIEITATLSGGRGDVAWQHAQLFRQSMDSKDYSFNIRFTFKNV